IFDFAEATSNRPLAFLTCYLFQQYGLIGQFKISTELFLKFIVHIEEGYHPDVPYHNSVHAADVLHAVSFFLSHPALKGYFNSLDMLSLFVASAIHDFDHPGFNNNFLIATGNEKAILYNDKSVLENHHLASSFKILQSPECNFLSALPKHEYKTVRSSIIDLVNFYVRH
ncbi:HD-domain/PDEase-like protein, partial [Rozella allomycis CSF55]